MTSEIQKLNYLRKAIQESIDDHSPSIPAKEVFELLRQRYKTKDFTYSHDQYSTN